MIDIPAVALPPQGASYNPPAQEHYALVVEAYKIEKRKQDEVDRLAQYRERIERAEQITTDDTADGVPPGMCLDEIDEDAEGTLPESNMVVPRKPPVRKTKQQRARMERHRAEVSQFLVYIAIVKLSTFSRNAPLLRKRCENNFCIP